MDLSTKDLVLAPDSFIDLQLHTTFSDGTWAPEQLLDHLVSENFGLAAITDHDRVDITATLQKLALEKHMPLLVAVEMTAEWRGEMTDVLCFGFDPERNDLNELAQDVIRRQKENTRAVYENLVKEGYRFSQDSDELAEILEKPSPQQLHELVALVKRHGYGTGDPSAGKIILGAGCAFATTDIGKIVEAGHKNGAVCIITHPGREDGFVTYDAQKLDDLRQEVPIDGLEAYYPLHSVMQTEIFLDYAQRHDLLVSSGSDSHKPDKPPIKYPARLIQALLERIGINIG